MFLEDYHQGTGVSPKSHPQTQRLADDRYLDKATQLPATSLHGAGSVHHIILARCNTLDTAFIHQLLQVDVVQKPEDLLAKIIPQLVSQTLVSVVTVVGPAAARGIYGFIHSRYNFGNRDFIGRAIQRITTTGSTGTADQFPFAQTGKQLLEVGQ